jgi:polar amino acid transport system substrate-binding protein
MNIPKVILLSAFVSVIAMIAKPAFAQDTRSTWQRIMETKTMRVGFAIGEPLAFKDITNSSAPGGVKFGDDTWRGVGPVLGKMIADALGVKIELIESSDAASIAGLQSNLIDLFLPIQSTPERAKAADFIPVPIMWQGMTFYSRTGNAPTTWAELNDPQYKIGVVLGAATDIFSAKRLPKAQLQRFPDTPSQTAALQSGRVDGIVMFGGNAAVAFGKLKMGKIITPTPFVLTTNEVAVRQEIDQRWHNYLTSAIQYYYESGTIEQIYDDFLAFRGIDPKDVLPVTRELWPK